MGRIVSRLARATRHLDRVPELVRCIRECEQPLQVASRYVTGAGRYPFRVVFRSGEEVLTETPHDLVTAWVIFLRREYLVPVDARVIVDAGANIGAFSLYAARQAPRARVLALEPFPSTVARLTQTLERNRLGERVRVLPVALAGEAGVRRIDDQEAPSQVRGMLESGAVGGVEVEALSLESLWRRESLDEVDLLKMDIEGAEHEVLLGASDSVLRKIRRLSLEYHPNRPRAPLFDRLLQSGFSLDHDVVAFPNSGVASFSRH